MNDAHLLEEFLLNPKFAPSTRRNYSIILREFTKFFPDKLLKEIAGYDLMKFLSSKSEGSQDTYLWVIRSFLRFVHDGELPKGIRRIQIKLKRRKIHPQDLLTPEEVRRLLDACDNIQDKTLLMLLYGTGCRISELLNAKVGDIVVQNELTRLHIDGKTGEHLAFIKEETVPQLRHYLAYLDPESPDQYLFPSVKNPYKPLNYNSWLKRLQKITECSGLKKRVHSHLFRHMRNTELVRTVGVDMTRRIMGYAENSSIIYNYTHLTDLDVTNAFLQSEGKPPFSPQRPQNLPPPIYSHPLAHGNQKEVGELREQLDETQKTLDLMIDKVLYLIRKNEQTEENP